jgi:hypothetical protein
VSELPRSDLGAHASVEARSTGAATSLRAPSATIADAEALERRSGRRAAFPAALTPSGPRHHDDDMLTVADAAHAARRSVRTLRRAYLSGRLTAHRDGNGRAVTIRYGDLRAWLTAKLIARPPAHAIPRAIARVDVRAGASTSAATGNAELLDAALQRRPRRARSAAAPRPAARPGFACQP